MSLRVAELDTGESSDTDTPAEARRCSSSPCCPVFTGPMGCVDAMHLGDIQ